MPGDRLTGESLFSKDPMFGGALWGQLHSHFIPSPHRAAHGQKWLKTFLADMQPHNEGPRGQAQPVLTLLGQEAWLSWHLVPQRMELQSYSEAQDLLSPTCCFSRLKRPQSTGSRSKPCAQIQGLPLTS